IVGVFSLCSIILSTAVSVFLFFFFQAEDGIRDRTVTGVQTCALPIFADIPSALRDIGDLQTAIPRIAKDPSLLNSIRKSVERIPTKHVLVHGDARKIDRDLTGAIHLVITFPPYWTLKKYRDTSGQLGHISDYDEFLTELDRVWEKCFHLLVPGGRLVCVVGDVCLSRRKNEGRHTVVPLHAAIRCRRIGF